MPDEDVSVEEIEMEAEDRMEKSLEAFKRDMGNIRSSRATTAMVEHIQADYYGAQTPLIQLASLSVPDARTILITPFDKGALAEIEKALLKSDIGITPQSDGSVIRMSLPDLSMERRHELVKQVKSRTEEARVSIRNIRRDTNDTIKKQGSLSDDEKKGGQDDIQKLTDRFIAEVEKLAAGKEQDILTV